MAFEIAETADRQWERDLVELLGLDFATDAYAKSRGPRVGVRMYLPILAGAVLAASIPAYILSERRLASETTFGSATHIRPSTAANNPVILQTMPSRLPDVRLGNADGTSNLAEEPLSLPVDEKARATHRLRSKPDILLQQLGKLSVQPRGDREASKTYAFAREQVRSVTANASAAPGGMRGESDAPQAVPDRSTVALSSADAARSDAQGYRPPASKVMPAPVDPGNGPLSRTSRQAALSGAEPTGLVREDDSVRIPLSQASSDKIHARDKRRRKEALDALRLLRRQ